MLMKFEMNLKMRAKDARYLNNELFIVLIVYYNKMTDSRNVLNLY